MKGELSRQIFNKLYILQKFHIRVELCEFISNQVEFHRYLKYVCNNSKGDCPYRK